MTIPFQLVVKNYAKRFSRFCHFNRLVVNSHWMEFWVVFLKKNEDFFPFWGVKDMLFLTHHRLIPSRIVWKFDTWFPERVSETDESSTYFHLSFQSTDKSLIIMMNNIGPKTVPCGTTVCRFKIWGVFTYLHSLFPASKELFYLFDKNGVNGHFLHLFYKDMMVDLVKCVWINQRVIRCLRDVWSVTRAVARALIGGGGGGIFIYSCYARRISFEISCF